MPRRIFVNLPVADLGRARAFFSSLGFGFDDRFCDETAACMAVADDINVMLLTHAKFAQFTPQPVADAHAATEVLIAIGVDSRAEVDRIVQRAVAAGGATFRDPADHGFMYEHAFRDPDGHIWELMWMDTAAMPGRADTEAA